MNVPILKSKVRVSLLTVVLFISAIAAISTMPEVNAQGPTLSMNPPLTEEIVSNQFTIDINITSVTDLKTWQFNITFNPALMEVVDVTEGPFLQSGGGTTLFANVTDNIGGFVLVGDTIIFGGTASGSGILATLTFHCKGVGNSSLDFHLPGTFLQDSASQPMQYLHENGAVNQVSVLPPTIYVDAPSNVDVSTEFDVIIWIRNIQSGWGLTEFYIQVNFDPNDLEFIDSEFLDPDDAGGWVGGGSINDAGNWTGGAQSGGLFDVWTEDRAWFVLTFHCLRAGPTPITVTSPPVGTIILVPIGGGQPVFFEPEPVTVIVNQVAPVGGVATPVNKLEILTPYIALAGLIVAVSAVYVIKKRKD